MGSEARARAAGQGGRAAGLCLPGFCLLLAAWALPAAAQTLFFADFPRSEIFSDSSLRITLSAVPPARVADSCALYHSPVPAGARLEGHTAKIAAVKSRTRDSTGLVFAFKPQDSDSGKTGAQLGLGFHYLIGYCSDGKLTPEVPLWVASRQAPTFLAPKAQEPSSNPSISWTPVPGVPAYHLLLSDQAIKIDADKGTVSGASIIWQVITTQTSIAYGTPDPSGNFSKLPAPPLSPNVPYNLVILDNYDGRSALATSSKAQGLKLFTIKPPGPSLPPPVNLAPAAGKTLAIPQDSLITFRWTRSRAADGTTANTYQLFIYSLEQQGDLNVLLPIWRTEVTDTTARLDGRRVLLTRRYVWKVFALSDAGAGTVGDTTSFLYRNDVQTLSVKVRSSADNQPLGDVRIAISPVDGAADPLPLFTANDGFAEKTMATGSYSLAFAKDGYADQARTIDLGVSAPLSLSIALAPSACRISGRMADKNGADLPNVTATAVGGGRTLTARSDAQGFFLLGVPAGTYSVSFAKPDYQSPPETTVAVAAGNAVDLGKLAMAQAQASLTGTVANDKGVPLPGCDVTVKTAAGAVVRALRTDDKGLFSAFLSPGSYQVTAERSGFTSQTRSVQLAEAASLAFELAAGASLVKGRVSILTWPTAGAPQSAPFTGAAVELVDRLRGTVLRTVSDLHGDYAFSADTGTYLARASAPGRAGPDSAILKVAAQRSTYSADLALKGFASVQGSIHVTPDTVLDPASVRVTLLDAGTLASVATAVPQAAPAAGAAGAMTFAFNAVPDGTYRLACGVSGYGLDAEPSVIIKNGIWKTGLDLVLKKATKMLTFAFTAGGQAATGSARLLTPQAVTVASGIKFGPAAAGTYTLDAIPDSADLIPLSRFGFSLPAAGAADTTLNLAFPFAHHPGPLAISGGQAEVVLQAQSRMDSISIIYGYGAPSDTFKAPLSLVFGPAGPRTIKFRPGPQGGILTYWFRIRAGALIYSNEDPARRFRAEVEPSRELASLTLAAGDSLRLPARTRGHLYLHAYDAAGRRLDSLVDAKAEVKWQADSALGLRLDRRSKRTLTYQTAAPTAPAEGAAAPKQAGAFAPKRGSAAGAWDSLRVTVTLEGIEKSLNLPTRVVEARANKLVLTSTLGETDRLDAPQAFGLFVSAFDTTLDPPLPVIADPAFALDPPEAGSVSEMQVALDSRFIGPLRLIARQVNADGSEAATELGVHRDSASRGLNVGQTLRAGDSARSFFHDKRLELRVPDSAFADKPQAALRLYRRAVAKSFASGLDYAVDGPLWEVANPSGAAFGKPPRISVGLQPGSRTQTLKRFDALKLEWRDPSDTAVAETNGFGMSAFACDIADLDGSYYGLLGASRPLTAGEVRIVPNPFSPEVMATRDGNTEYGTRIRVDPESDRSSEVTLTAKIYTLDWELLRTLVDHKTLPKAPFDFYWDGKADGGRWARNGRYLLQIAVNATGSTRTRYTLKPVVVFR